MPVATSTFAPLKYPTYRALLAASLVANLGVLVQGVGAGWLMTSLTDDPGMVALVQCSLTLPLAVLSLFGGFAGLLFGATVAWLLGEAASQLPVSFSTLFMGLALGLSVVIGLVAGILPAMSAAKLDPVEALRAE